MQPPDRSEAGKPTARFACTSGKAGKIEACWNYESTHVEDVVTLHFSSCEASNHLTLDVALIIRYQRNVPAPLQHVMITPAPAVTCLRLRSWLSMSTDPTSFTSTASFRLPLHVTRGGSL